MNRGERAAVKVHGGGRNELSPTIFINDPDASNRGGPATPASTRMPSRILGFFFLIFFSVQDVML